MEHLPPVHVPHQPLSIPYLGGAPYDNQDFVNYPTRQNWNVQALLAGDLQGRTNEEAAQFLQTWLWFGMIHHTFAAGRHVEQDDFIRVDAVTKERYVCTAEFSRYFNAWRGFADRGMGLAREGSGWEWYGIYREGMIVACGVWRDLMRQSEDEDRTTPLLLGHEILLSIQVLGAALDIGVTEVCTDDRKYIWRVVPRSDWMMQRMVRQGWCPCVVEQLSRPCATFLYYCSLLGVPASRNRHVGCVAGDVVGERVCVESNTREDEHYVAKHVVEGCGCDFVVFDTSDGSEIAESIRNGSIPLVKLKGQGAELSISTAFYSKEVPERYTAISHVWSDGLGNPTENKLYHCQLSRLSRLISNLPRDEGTTSENQPIHLWMDTLCVPANNPSLRKQAINIMDTVYTQATNVLVLSSDLLPHDTTEMSINELYARITCSPWLRRLWTLQEAVLNDNVLVQFADRAVNVRPLTTSQDDVTHHQRARPWDLVAWESTRYTLEKLELDVNKFDTFRQSQIWSAAQGRITSRQGDEALCLAILLGLNLEELQSVPEQERIARFWRLHERHGVPAQVLWLPGRKLRDEGFRWAPGDIRDLTLVGSAVHQLARVTNRGLHVTYPGFILEAQLAKAVTSVIPCEIDGSTFYIRQNLRGGTEPWNGLEFHKIGKLAIILLMVVKGGETAAGGFEAGLGVLTEVVDVQGRDGEEIEVGYLRFVSVVKKGCFHDLHPNVPWSLEEMEEKGRVASLGRFLAGSQRWCVG